MNNARLVDEDILHMIIIWNFIMRQIRIAPRSQIDTRVHEIEVAIYRTNLLRTIFEA